MLKRNHISAVFLVLCYSVSPNKLSRHGIAGLLVYSVASDTRNNRRSVCCSLEHRDLPGSSQVRSNRSFWIGARPIVEGLCPHTGVSKTRAIVCMLG